MSRGFAPKNGEIFNPAGKGPAVYNVSEKRSEIVK